MVWYGMWSQSVSAPERISLSLPLPPPWSNLPYSVWCRRDKEQDVFSLTHPPTHNTLPTTSFGTGVPVCPTRRRFDLARNKGWGGEEEGEEEGEGRKGLARAPGTSRFYLCYASFFGRRSRPYLFPVEWIQPVVWIGWIGWIGWMVGGWWWWWARGVMVITHTCRTCPCPALVRCLGEIYSISARGDFQMSSSHLLGLFSLGMDSLPRSLPLPLLTRDLSLDKHYAIVSQSVSQLVSQYEYCSSASASAASAASTDVLQPSPSSPVLLPRKTPRMEID